MHACTYTCAQTYIRCIAIIPQVTFPSDLDVFDFCTPELRKELEGPRAALKDWEDEQVGGMWGGGKGPRVGRFPCACCAG
jgi:hypothetical protein